MTPEIASALLDLASKNDWPYLPSLVALMTSDNRSYRTGQQLIDQGVTLDGIDPTQLYFVMLNSEYLPEYAFSLITALAPEQDLIITEVPPVAVCQVLAQAYLTIFPDDATIDV